MRFLTLLKSKAKQLKSEILVLYLVLKHPKTPWYAKIVVAVVVGYALSPIDLIPDFIPVLGYLDDLILIPLGIFLALKLVPQSIVLECRAKASELHIKFKKILMSGLVIVGIWILLAAIAIFWLLRRF